MDATVEFQWASVLVPALAALVGAAVGGFFTLIAASRTTKSAARQALKAQRAEWRRQDEANRERLALQEAQHRRELLTRAVGILLDVLWAKERRLCDALHLARTNLTDSPVSSDDKALQLLGALDLETRADMLRALPYIHDLELKSRLESVQVVVNAAYNLRAAGQHHVTNEEYSRAMLETQWYFKWLRWNLECALLGEALPAGVTVPDLRRPLSEPAWPIPEGMPDHA
ncbi:hypothetical protein OOZ51_14445 [Arthrobacter sp. MI7-26]|uniref:hypothetical protein n=1 Tax=Arthrobacter sp. MI7-26 TaxID=2993653 RepID=UPI0022494BD8|nr:hypothetical protein [Arthrobacter sp. MI7-26]MCX2749005.1 hypothetical protein [Arthrobacter sp. MI7-26]